jgi:hypothetical protein
MVDWAAGGFPCRSEVLRDLTATFEPMEVSHPVAAAVRLSFKVTGEGANDATGTLWITFQRRRGSRNETYLLTPAGMTGPVSNPIPPTVVFTGGKSNVLQGSFVLSDPKQPVVFLPGDSRLQASVALDRSASVHPEFIELHVQSWGPWMRFFP